MILSDITAVLQWWFVILVLGIGFLPLTVLFFSKFLDNGYIFSKILAILIVSYVIFVFGILHFLPFSQLNSYIVIMLIIVGLNLLLPLKWRFWYLFKKNWRYYVFEEVLFLLGLAAWSYIHGFHPDIHGLEKYMDFGFINSILRTEYFPPKDMWFTPYPINYYYYGHFVTAFLIQISGIPANYGFNIMLATVFALCLTQSFSIGANLYNYFQANIEKKATEIKLVIVGLVTSALVTFAGNLHIVYAFFKPYENEHPKPLWELTFSPLTFPNSYWYPNATRFIYNTIHEFPIYSWVVADLHGHVLDIPFVLLLIALLLLIYIRYNPRGEEEISDVKWKSLWLESSLIKRFKHNFLIHPIILIFIGFLLAVMYMTNAWDGAIYLMLTSLVLFYLFWENFRRQVISLILLRLIIPLLMIVSFFLIFSFPYNYYFQPFASGIGVLCAPEFLAELERTNTVNGQSVTEKGRLGPFLFEKDHCQHSYWWELVTLYGFFYFFVITFVIYLLVTKKILRSDGFILVLIVTSTFLILLPEFIYVKDIYPGHYRANTMFKLVFQAFIMLSISSAYILFRLAHGKTRFFILPISTILISLVLTYPYLAIPSYYNFTSPYKSLDGTEYLKIIYPDDYFAINWLNSSVTGQPVILEAQGDSYTDYARVSSNTGLPTVLGWTVHEWLWRGDYSIPAPRITDVQNMYELTDTEVTKQLLKQYNVEYVFIGALEYQKYPNLQEQKFQELGRVVYQKGDTKIYKLNIE